MTAAIVAVATAAVVGGLWLLDHLVLVPISKLRTYLARIALVGVVLVMFTVPAAYQKGMAWFVERKTDDMLEQIQPVLDELTARPAPGTDVAPHP